MRDKLSAILEDKSFVEKIVEAYIKYGTMSAGYLAHKFRFNPYVCKQIMKIIKDWEKSPD